MMELFTVLRLTALLSGVHAVFSALELFTVRSRYGERQLMDWRIVRLGLKDRAFFPVVAPFLTRFTYVLVGRVVLGVALVASVVAGAVPAVVVAALLFTDVLMMWRHVGGLSGAFHMSVVVNAGLILALLAPGGSTLELAAVLFIAVQGILGYFVAGIAKLMGEEWRNGLAIGMVLSTDVWGHPRAYDLVERVPHAKLVGAWVVITFETLFPLVLVLDAEFVLAAFAGGVLFHLFNAVVLGINGFVVIFPATYPAIYYANGLVTGLW